MEQALKDEDFDVAAMAALKKSSTETRQDLLWSLMWAEESVYNSHPLVMYYQQRKGEQGLETTSVGDEPLLTEAERLAHTELVLKKNEAAKRCAAYFFCYEKYAFPPFILVCY